MNSLDQSPQLAAHAAGIETLRRLIEALTAGESDKLRSITGTAPTAATSHLGVLIGIEEVAGIFAVPAGLHSTRLETSNVYLAGTLSAARASAYLSGTVDGSAGLGFGAVMIVDLARGRDDGPWEVKAMKLQLTWLQGDTSLRPQWTLPRFEKVWGEGDSLPVIVSEIDAPWHVYPESEIRGGETREVVDTYARYSWGIDQADFGLLTGCYTEDAAGTFRPMGPLTGRHAIIGVLKDFRRAWPMMQHYGVVLGTLIEGETAAIIVGRVIPQEAREKNVFGAYYPMRLRRDGGIWRITWSEYRPGWFLSDEVDVDELLSITISGEGDWAA